MYGQLKTLAAAIVTMLIGASFAESAEIRAEAGEEQFEAVGQPSADETDTPNVMGDLF